MSHRASGRASVYVVGVVVLAAAAFFGLLAGRFWGEAGDAASPTPAPEAPPEIVPAAIEPPPAPGPPSADQILDRSIEVTGGRAAYEKINDVVVSESMLVQVMGAEFGGTKYIAPPDKILKVYETTGMRMQAATNGDISWQRVRDEPPKLIEGQDHNLLRREITWYLPIYWKQHYDKAECLGLEQFEGQECYKLIMTPKSGKPETRYYAKDSGLLVMDSVTVTRAMGDIQLEARFSDYRQTGDILAPYAIKQTQSSQDTVITVKSIEYNTGVPAERFELPEDAGGTSGGGL